jgi:hypothetical protein
MGPLEVSRSNVESQTITENSHQRREPYNPPVKDVHPATGATGQFATRHGQAIGMRRKRVSTPGGDRRALSLAGDYVDTNSLQCGGNAGHRWPDWHRGQPPTPPCGRFLLRSRVRFWFPDRVWGSRVAVWGLSHCWVRTQLANTRSSAGPVRPTTFRRQTSPPPLKSWNARQEPRLLCGNKKDSLPNQSTTAARSSPPRPGTGGRCGPDETVRVSRTT